MRVSTEGLYRVSLDALQTQQSRLASVQNQIASGKRYTAASEAPDAVAAVLRLDQRAAELAQYQHNADQATLSLNLEEQALSDGQNILQRLRELAVQANSSTLSSDDLAAIAAADEDESAGESRQQAMGLLAALVGAVVLARAVDNEALSGEILRSTRQFIANGLAADTPGK